MFRFTRRYSMIRKGCAALLLSLSLLLISGSSYANEQLSETWIEYPDGGEHPLPGNDGGSESRANPQMDDSLITQMFIRFVGKVFPDGGELKKFFPLKPGSIFQPAECQAVSSTLALGRRIITSVSVLEEVITGVCMIGNRNYEMCSGIAKLYATPALHIVRQSNLTSEEMASLLLGTRCMSRSRFLKSKLNWKITLPPKTSTTRNEQINLALHSKDDEQDRLPDSHIKEMKGPHITFIQMNDVHLDFQYSGGKDVECSFPLCCRNNNERIDWTTDGSGERSGDWGSLEGNCDCPLNLALSTLKAINESISRKSERLPGASPQSTEPSELNQSKPPDYIIWAGDILPHDVWATSEKEMIETASEWTRQVKRFLSDAHGVPVFPVLGNHEAVPVNMFSPPGETTGSSEWIYQKFYDLWKDWFTIIDSQYGGNANQYFKSTGSYSFSLSERIRIIVLNTVYCSKNNYWNLRQPEDLGSQLSFLVSELREAESRGQSAHIVGHNPPNAECTETWLRNYIRVLGRFKSVITGSFFGHTHSDQYYLYFGKDNGNAYGTAFVGGSITTFGHVNPCYKIYTMSKDKGVVLDQETFYADVAEANRMKSPPKWKLLYSSRDAYGLEDLSTSQMLRLFRQLERDPEKRHMYWDFLHRKSNASDWRTCGTDCIRSAVREIQIISPSP